jgi:hypothetical protein
MPDFDFHRRRLQARLRLIGTDPVVSRALLKRWSAALGERAQMEPDALRLPPVPLADLTGFDVQVKVEHEGGAAAESEGVDAWVLVVGSNAGREHDLRLLLRRAREGGNAGPALWSAEQGWSEALAALARRLGVEDDVLRAEVSSRRGALSCLEVATACLIDHALLRIHPAAPGEGAPDAQAVGERILAWARMLCPPEESQRGAPAPDSAAASAAAPAGGRTPGLAPEGGSERASAAAASPDEPWRRRAMDLEKIDPLPAADAAQEIRTLDLILKFTPLLNGPAGVDGVEEDNPTRTPIPATGTLRR